MFNLIAACGISRAIMKCQFPVVNLFFGSGPREAAQRPGTDTFYFPLSSPACQPFQIKEPKAIIHSNGQMDAGEIASRSTRSILPNYVEGVRLKATSTDSDPKPRTSVEGDFLDSLGKMKSDLKAFHILALNQTPERRLWLLQEMQTFFYPFNHRLPIAVRREQFLTNKRNWRYFKRPCFVCVKKANIRHHVISLKQGGCPGAKRNIVALCNGCHAEIHPWLKRSSV